MNEEYKDPRLDPEVQRVYWEMSDRNGYICEVRHYDAKGKPDLKYAVCAKCGKRVKSLGIGYMRESIEKLRQTPCPIPDPITMSVGDLADYMMRQVLVTDYVQKLRRFVGSDEWWDLVLATPEQRIRAACKAWKGKK